MHITVEDNERMNSLYKKKKFLSMPKHKACKRKTDMKKG